MFLRVPGLKSRHGRKPSSPATLRSHLLWPLVTSHQIFQYDCPEEHRALWRCRASDPLPASPRVSSVTCTSHWIWALESSPVRRGQPPRAVGLKDTYDPSHRAEHWMRDGLRLWWWVIPTRLRAQAPLCSLEAAERRSCALSSSCRSVAGKGGWTRLPPHWVAGSIYFLWHL